MPKTTKQFNFEKALTELESITSKMEQGDLELEDALKQFETGIKLIRQCQQALTQAEQKISLLTEKNGEIVASDFESDLK